MSNLETIELQLLEIRNLLMDIRDRLPVQSPRADFVAPFDVAAFVRGNPECTCVGLPQGYTYRTGCPVHDKVFARPR